MALPTLASFRTAYPELDDVAVDREVTAEISNAGGAIAESEWSDATLWARAVRAQAAHTIAVRAGLASSAKMYAAQLAEIASERADASQANTRAPVGPKTTAAIDLYVAATGDDSAAGTPAAPLLTINAAIALIPDEVLHDVRIYVGAGTFAPFNLGQRNMRNGARIAIIGTEVDVLASVASLTDTTTLVIKGTGWTANAYRGMTLEVLSGTALGDKRTINDNTTTDILPCRPFTTGIAAGDLIRVTKPATLISCPTGDHILVDGIGTIEAGSWPSKSSCAVLVNLAFERAAGDDSAGIIRNSKCLILGCEVPTHGGGQFLLIPQSSHLALGFEDNGADVLGVPSGVDLLGAPSATSLKGWGFSYRAASTQKWLLIYGGTQSFVDGYYVGPAVVITRMHVNFRGGKLFGGSTSTTLLVDTHANAFVTGETGTPFVIADAGSANGAVRTATFGNLLMTNTTVANAVGPGLLAETMGLITTSGVTGSGATFGTLVRRGGRAHFFGVPAVTGTTADLSVDGSTGSANATLNAAGAHLAHTDCSVIQRVS